MVSSPSEDLSCGSTRGLKHTPKGRVFEILDGIVRTCLSAEEAYREWLKQYQAWKKAQSQQKDQSTGQGAVAISIADNKMAYRPEPRHLALGARLRQLITECGCAHLLSTDAEGHLGFTCGSLYGLRESAVLNRAVLELLFDHSPKFTTCSYPSLLSLFLTAKDWDPATFIKHAKFLTAWPMAKYLDNDLPPTPSTWKCKSPSGPSLSDVFTGALLRMLQNRLRVKHISNLRLWWGFLQGVKRGCLPAEDSFIIQSLKDHSEALAKTPGLSGVDNEFTQMMSQKLQCLWDRAANNGLPPALRKRNRGLRPIISKANNMVVPPKTGACFEASVAEGGAHGHLYENLHAPLQTSNRTNMQLSEGLIANNFGSIDLKEYADGVNKEIVWMWQKKDFEEGRDLLSMWYTPKTGVREERGNLCPYSFTELTEFAKPAKLNQFPDRTPLDEQCATGLEFDDYDHTRVQIIALTEPLKVRTISKGNALKYWLARPVQKIMRETLARMPQFVLTGTPLCIDHIEWLWNQTDSVIHRVSPHLSASGQHIDLDFSWVVSGDYKGATDGLDINATKAAFEQVLSMLDISSGFAHHHVNHGLTCDRYKDILRDVLYEQRLCYSTGKKRWMTNQTNGQLMGSNLSFPILCAINLVGYWMALEEYLGVRLEPHDLPVLINGDDILFRTTKPDPSNPKSFYEIWKRVISQLGFELSVGKNYVHDSIFTVNSECWVVQSKEGHRSFKKIDYLPIGLLTNVRTACRLEDRQLSLVDVFNQTLAGSRNKQRTFSRLKHYYLQEVKEWTHKGRYNLCGHILLGGLGVNSQGVDPGFTRSQRRWAKWNRNNLLACSTREELSRHHKIQPVPLHEEEEVALAKGDSYEIPSGGRPITWLPVSEYDQKSSHVQEKLKIRKDLRSLPSFTRPQAIRFSRISLPSFRTLRTFKKVVALHVLSQDGQPDQLDVVPCNVERDL